MDARMCIWIYWLPARGKEFRRTGVARVYCDMCVAALGLEKREQCMHQFHNTVLRAQASRCSNDDDEQMKQRDKLTGFPTMGHSDRESRSDGW